MESAVAVGDGASVVFDMRDILSKVARRYSIELDTIDYSETSLAVDTKFETPDTVTRPYIVEHTQIFNGGSAPVEKIFNVGKTVTDTFRWSMTEGLKIEIRTMVEVSFPLLAKGESEMKGEVSIGSTQEKTSTTTYTWNEQYKVTAPPHKEIVATAVVDDSIGIVYFDMDIKLGGRVKLIGKDASYVSYPIADWVHEYVPTGMHISQYTPSGTTPGTITIRARGKYSSVQMVNKRIETKEYDYPRDSDVEDLLEIGTIE